MIRNNRIFSAEDKHKLVAAIERAERCWLTDVPHLSVFRSVVRRLPAVRAAAVPADVITMNSRFILENVITGESDCYELVYPADAAIERHQISVLSPPGMTLIGARVGEEMCWASAVGPTVAKVRRLVHQPEAAMRCDGAVEMASRKETRQFSRNLTKGVNQPCCAKRLLRTQTRCG
jgi:regulator of nucleoside diphosphate kinase